MESSSSLNELIQSIFTSAEILFTDEQLAKCLNLLNKLFTNIVNNPKETKFRTIKRSNKVLKEKVFTIPDLTKIFFALQFQEANDEELVFKLENIDQLRTALKKFQQLEKVYQFKLLTPAQQKQQLEMEERQRSIEYEHQRKLQEQEKIRKQAELDRKEKAQEQVRGSKANKSQFGMKGCTFKDIGVDLSKQKGG